MDGRENIEKLFWKKLLRDFSFSSCGTQTYHSIPSHSLTSIDVAINMWWEKTEETKTH